MAVAKEIERSIEGAWVKEQKVDAVPPHGRQPAYGGVRAARRLP